MPYNSRSRVFSYILSPKEMERYMKREGYVVISLSKIVRDYGYTCSELVKKLNLYPSTFSYKVTFKPEEKDLVYRIFINTITTRSNIINKKDYDYDYVVGGKWFWNNSSYVNDDIRLINFFLEERVMKVLSLNFKKLINYGRN